MLSTQLSGTAGKSSPRECMGWPYTLLCRSAMSLRMSAISSSRKSNEPGGPWRDYFRNMRLISLKNDLLARNSRESALKRCQFRGSWSSGVKWLRMNHVSYIFLLLWRPLICENYKLKLYDGSKSIPFTKNFTYIEFWKTKRHTAQDCNDSSRWSVLLSSFWSTIIFHWLTLLKSLSIFMCNYFFKIRNRHHWFISVSCL